MSKYKLIAFDVDDTLLTTEKVISPKTKQALLNAQKNGIKLCVASGRLPYGVKPYAEELDVLNNGGYYLGFNGGAVLNSYNELIGTTYLDSKYIEPVYEVLRPTNVTTMVHKGDIIYADRKVNDYTHIEPDVIGLPLNLVDDIAEFVDWKLHKILLCGEPGELKEVESKLKAKFADDVDIYLSAPWFLEVMPNGVNKGLGVEKVCADMGISMDEVMAFGDNYNDIPMLEMAGLGIAMGNAEDEVKNSADYVTDTCDLDGIAKALGKFL
ncbi:MAG: Cof-type HAD-IIB family hydrolase [Ruminococcus sp.]|nr:Cof-type HAD-IIB family hydrolase [Ruminococcus sp.]